jgi:hypothetical protein
MPDQKENLMASLTTSRSPYVLRLELVRDTLMSHSKLKDKEASELAEHVLQALNSIPEKIRWAGPRPFRSRCPHGLSVRAPLPPRDPSTTGASPTIVVGMLLVQLGVWIMTVTVTRQDGDGTLDVIRDGSSEPHSYGQGA